MKRKICSLFLLFLLSFLAVSACLIYFDKKEHMDAKKQYQERLSLESYDSVFFSMYPINNYSVEDFTTYRAVTPILSDYAISDFSEIGEFLETAFASGNDITNVYLGLDPYLMWTSLGKKNERWEQALELHLLSYITAHPALSFEILFPYPSIKYWASLKEKELDTAFTTYDTLIHTLEPYSNVTVYFVGAEEWLIANPGNYTDAFETNYQVSLKLMLLTFCDHNLQIEASDTAAVFADLKSRIRQEKESPETYPDLTGWDIVFFGDSIMGNFSGSASIPGVINGLTRASVYNYAIGGTPAASAPDADNTFLPVVNSFLNRQLTATRDGTCFPYDDRQESANQLCFIIHYGLNDYFNGQPMDNQDDPYDSFTYAGALRSGICLLKEAYPEATIIVMSPPFCTYYSGGTDRNGDAGGTLIEYVSSASQVAREMNVLYFDSYHDLGITADNAALYLADGCHLNETGRFLEGKKIIRLLEQHQGQ